MFAINILYVEDDPLIAEVYSIMITDAVPGSTIEVIEDAKKAIELVKKIQINFNSLFLIRN